MNYQYHYDELIRVRGLKKKPSGYSERHHVVPKWMGGTDDDHNMIYLTFKDHVFAHWLLWKIYRDKSSAYSYYMMMKRKKSNPNPTIEQFAQTNKGRKQSPEEVERRISKIRGKPKPDGFGDALSKKLKNKHHLAKAVVINGVEYKSARQAGEILGISHRTVGRMVKRGEAFYTGKE